jgi:hypothetical protein
MGIYERIFGSDGSPTPSVDNSEDTDMYGWTAAAAADEAMKYAVDVPEITWKDVGNVALDFTPVIGDIKGGYETVALIGEELEKENPNYYLIGAMGGLGAVGTILGLVPAVGDVAQKAIMDGTRYMADRSGQLAGEITGAARAVRDGDLEFLLARGNVDNTQGVGAEVVRKDPEKALKAELDPAGMGKTRLPTYADEVPKNSVPKGNLVDKKEVNIEQLQKDNAVFHMAQGDRSATDETLYGVGDMTFQTPVDLDGGRGFMRNPRTGLWASDETVAGKVKTLAERIADKGGNPHVLYASMAGQSGDFNTMMSDTVMEMIKESDISSKAAKKYDKWVKENVDPNWMGILHPDTKEYLRLLPEDGGIGGTKRRLLWQELDAKKYQDDGFPQLGLARIGITEDDLLMTPKLQTSSVGRVNPTGEFLYGPRLEHNTYSRQVPGEYVGELEDAPLQLLMRDFFEQRRAGGYARQDDQRSLGFRSNTLQAADQQMVDEMKTYAALVDQSEKEAYLRSLPSGGGPQPEPKIYKFGDNGGPPLDPLPSTDIQMSTAFGDELEIGTSQFNIENPNVVLKNHTIDDLEAIDLNKSTAGGPKKNAMINAPVEEGAEKSVRLNLNSKIDPDGPPAPFNRLQTVHPINSKGVPNYSKAESYLPAVTLEKGTFHVDQKKRRAIAEDGKKVPAMSVQGNVTSQRNVLNEMDDTVVEVGINPFDKHLFIDMKTGQAVKGFDIATVYRDRVYAKGVTYWKKAEAPKPLPANGDTPIVNQVRYAFNRGGLMSAY